MPSDRSSSEVNLDVALGLEAQAREAKQQVNERVFRLAICADLRGRSGTDMSPSKGAAAWRVDRDDFDEVLSTIAPQLQLDLGSGIVADVRIRDLDDFHPDQLFDRVPQFAQLRELRTRLADPATFQRAAAQLAAPPAPRPAARKSSASLLDSIVDAESPASLGDTSRATSTGSSSRSSGGASDELYDFIQRVMAPHLVARADPRQAEILSRADQSIQSVMRVLLHHPVFQALEATWRGIFRLVRQVDTDERLQIHLIDVTREELVEALVTAASPRESRLHARLASLARPEDGGWGALVAHYAFGSAADDVAVLAQLAGVGAALDAPWLAEASPELALGSLAEPAQLAWQRLRATPVARFLALAIPRVLLRLPYGSDSDEIERFAFEELESAESHGSYLWGNPALCCAQLLADGFALRGDGLAVGASSLIEGLPLHLVRKDGVTTAKPCAEVLMSEDDAAALLDAGMIPMLSFKDQDVVRVARIQSIAEPIAPLAGRLAR